MRIKSVHIQDYKRFTDLRVGKIPESAKLVVLIGPNGSGKSSLFDAFLLKSHESRGNSGLSSEQVDYYLKDTSTAGERPQTTAEVRRKVDVNFHGRDLQRDEWAAAFHIRSAYRNEPDFEIAHIERVRAAAETHRFERIIDPDVAVSDNYRRMTWQGLEDLFGKKPGKTTFDEYRRQVLGDLQKAMRTLFTHPVLELQDFGGIQDSGAFRFGKGTASDFHYKNLSGGEKAAFDLLLDIFVKRDEFQNAIYCIDEPEAHVATALHGRLLETMLELIPEESQLWIATHSVGFVRKAHERMRRENDVAFLDFTDVDFDIPAQLTPRKIDRSAWRPIYGILLDDLSHLIAPENIIICEGAADAADRGFDAQVYMGLFGESHSDTLFISRGGKREVERSKHLTTILKAVAGGINVTCLVDRDSEDAANEASYAGRDLQIRRLRRRELENYLYAPEVLRILLLSKGCSENEVSAFLSHRKHLVGSETDANADVKKIAQELVQKIRQLLRLPGQAGSREDFALKYLAPALKDTPAVLKELREDVFG